MNTRSDVPDSGPAGAPELTFWGVRGSRPVPGPDMLLYGGNTACIEVRLPEGRYVVDAGTGIVNLGRRTLWPDDEPIHLLMTHLHHDHVTGLPFFGPVHHKGREIHVWCGNLGGASAEAALLALLAPPLFPLTLEQMPARFIFHGFHAGETLRIGPDRIRTVALDHPSGATGYRFDTSAGSAAIITDIEHRSGVHDPAVVALCEGVSTLVYDMMFDEAEYGARRGWGHSTAEAAVRLADAAGARQLVGFHHSPNHTDAIMRGREARLVASRPGSRMAREGMSLLCANQHDG